MKWFRRSRPNPIRRLPAPASQSGGKKSRRCARRKRRSLAIDSALRPRVTMTEELLTYAGPIFEVDGEANGEMARDILRLEIEETTAGLKTLSARLVAQGPPAGGSDQQLLYLDGSVVDFGKKLSVVLGAEPART